MSVSSKVVCQNGRFYSLLAVFCAIYRSSACRLVAEGARIALTVPADGKGDRLGHLAYG